LPQGVDGALDLGEKAGAEIEVASRVHGLMANGLEDTLGYQAAVNLADAGWPDAWIFVQGNQLACHERVISGPWRLLVGQPFNQVGQ
jgi:hypothetical protein